MANGAKKFAPFLSSPVAYLEEEKINTDSGISRCYVGVL